MVVVNMEMEGNVVVGDKCEHRGSEILSWNVFH